jgi:hypothetical protein
MIAFLVTGHVAMITGMLDPTLGGWTPAQAPSMDEMPMSSNGTHAGHDMTN